jgi:hypothetical protein
LLEKGTRTMRNDQSSTPPSVSREQVEANKIRQKEARDRAERESREKHDKELSRKAWLADGVDEASFADAWPGVRDEARRRRVVERQEREQRRISKHYAQEF